MVEQNVEAALATEMLKLTALEGEALAALGVTIENSLSRFALAILAQANSLPGGRMEVAAMAVASA